MENKQQSLEKMDFSWEQVLRTDCERHKIMQEALNSGICLPVDRFFPAAPLRKKPDLPPLFDLIERRLKEV